MDEKTETNWPSRRERVLQHGFRSSPEGVRAMARIAGAAIIVDGGDRSIGANHQPPITPEDDPKLYRAYQNWLVKADRKS